MADFLDEVEASVPALRRYATALVGDRDRADDLVQDCLERAIRKRRLWRPTASVEAWLFTILLNVYRNDRRNHGRRGHLVPVEALEQEPAAAPEQPDRLALAETARAIDRLPADQRQALLLVALQGFSYADAGAILGIPTGTLMSRLGRARTTLRRLTREERDPPLRTVK